MKRLWWFILASVIFEGIALVVSLGGRAVWILEIIVALFILYMLWLAFAGMQRQMNLDLPPSMNGKVVRKRHWRLF